jgi:DNA invertase Pin-like site-specific DNA recombinase
MAKNRQGTDVRAAIYCRISQDRGAEGLGVERQRADCEDLCARRGWAVADVFVDNDVSAYAAKRRPGYDRLIEGLKAARFSALLAWAPDRLHRSPRELEDFVDLIESTGAAVATVQAGELDLSTAAGRMTARVVGAVARHESEQKSERVRRQREQAASAGRPHGGGRRAFGYTSDGAGLVEAEAALVREGADRALAGESLRSIARDWNARGLRSAGSGEWSIVTLRTLLTGPRIAGLRVFRGEIVGEGTWPPIITRDEHDRLRAVLGNARARGRGRPPTSLLGGLIHCGRCGAVMHASRRTNGTRRYACNVAPGHRGCGGVAIQAERTEQLVTDAVLHALDSPVMRRALARARTPTGAGNNPEMLQAELDQLAEAAGRGDLPVREYLRARQPLEERRRRALAAIETDTALAPMLDSADLGDAWDRLDTEGRRAVIGSVIEEVTIRPASGPGTKFDPERIKPIWRV